MPNIKKPVELKKLEGTYRKDRDSEEEKKQEILKTSPIILQAVSVSCPKSITDKYCRKYWKKLTHDLLSIHDLSEVDIPQIEMVFIHLQTLRALQAKLMMIDVLDESFDEIYERYSKAEKRFSTLAGKYYISPADRAKLKLDELSVLKAEQEVKKDDAISQLLAQRI